MRQRMLFSFYSILVILLQKAQSLEIAIWFA